MYKEFAKSMRTLKRPVNYMLIVGFLIAITVYPLHMKEVAETLTLLPMPIQMLILSVIGGSHLIRSYRKDIMDKD